MWKRTKPGCQDWAWVPVVLVAVVTAWLAAWSPGRAAETEWKESVQRCLQQPSAACRERLLRYARTHAGTRRGGLAYLALARVDLQEGHSATAREYLATARSLVADLADYADYLLALAYRQERQPDRALDALQRVIRHQPRSPFLPDAVVLAARLYIEHGSPATAARLLADYLEELPQPVSLALLGQAYEASGQLERAALAYQRVYYEYPVSAEAKFAASRLEGLKQRLGSKYPPPTAEAMFTRVDRLIRAGEHLQARTELQRMTMEMSGPDRDKARVWLGRARYIRGHSEVAYRWLHELKVADPAADAERLYYLIASARRLGYEAEMEAALRQLRQRYASSPWHLQALIWVANHYLVQNAWSQYEPLFRTCGEIFRNQPEAAYCLWKVAWLHYLQRRPDAGELLWEFLKRYPDSAEAPAALYFLGRWAERRRNLAEAAVYYQELAHEYPNYYYATLARERLASPKFTGVEATDGPREQLAGIAFPPRRHRKDFDLDEATERRLLRGRSLREAGLEDWARRELTFAANVDAKKPVVAVELARWEEEQENYFQAIRYIKRYAEGYLLVPLEEAPEEFWRLAFPWPYRELIEKYARQRGLDPYVVVALIRQESEFNPRAVSPASARGLMQVLPSTGRLLHRRLGYRRFSPSLLHQPEVNINLGTYYLRQLIDELDGHVVAALAAYNAGQSRARAWLRWGEFEEPAEYVETIPFTETRKYVQTVLRDAEIYRRLYR